MHLFLYAAYQVWCEHQPAEDVTDVEKFIKYLHECNGYEEDAVRAFLETQDWIKK